MGLLGGSGVCEAVGHGGAVFFAVVGGVERVGGAVEAGAAEVIYEKVSSEGGDPGLEAALLEVEAGEILVELEEDVLGEVFGVGAGAGEAVADRVDAAMLRDDELLPRLGVAGHALADEPGERFICSILFWRPLQLYP